MSSSPSIYSIDPNHLSELTPELSVEFFRKLLWAESTTSGFAPGDIDIPSRVDVQDGGIDAVTKGALSESVHGIIKTGRTHFQIKSGAFTPSDSAIKEILFKENETELKPRIKECLDNGERLVVVFFKFDNPDTTTDGLIKRFLGVLEQVDVKYRTANVEIWRQNILRGLFEKFTSLVVQIKGGALSRFKTFDSWDRLADMSPDFKTSQAQVELIENIRKLLKLNNEAIHVRLMGEPGIGKTRMALEALKDDSLRHLVLYCESAEGFVDSDLQNEILLDDSKKILLVIDECDADNRATIWNRLKYLGPRIKLITLSHLFEQRSTGNISYLDLPDLPDEKISEIIQSYGIPKDVSDRWADLCSGSPRVANVIGNNLKNNPEDLLRDPDVVQVWNRFIAGADDLDGEAFRRKRLVLMRLAMFLKFGFEGPWLQESNAISAIIKNDDPAITFSIFQMIVKGLKEQKILQGIYSRYITPKALHIKLWIECWDTFGVGFNYDELTKDFTPQLRDWFHEMFQYARHSAGAIRIVKELLSEKGPFYKDSILRSKLGAGFFLALTNAAPDLALDCLNKTIGTWSEEKLKDFSEGRREIIHALERMVIWRDLFQGASLLLLKLAEAENESWANNATGVFSGLFSNAYGKVAPSEASPKEKFPVLKEALESHSKSRRLIALRACDRALEANHFSRAVGSEFQGLRQPPKLWTPETWDEWFDGFNIIVKLLMDHLDSLESDEQKICTEILIKRARGLSWIPTLTDLSFEMMRTLSEKTYADKRFILQEIINILKFDEKRVTPEFKVKWEKFRDDLTGHDFSSMMRRYVGMSIHDDDFDGEGNPIDRGQVAIQNLVKQVIENPGILEKELGWLITNEAQNGYRFGYELGKADKKYTLIKMLIAVYRIGAENLNMFFLSGYLRAMFENEKETWEKTLDQLATDEKLLRHVAELTWRSGISEQAAARIVELVKDKKIEAKQFVYFAYGTSLKNISERMVTEWILLLMTSGDKRDVSSAIDICNHYISVNKIDKVTLPRELLFNLLTHPYFYSTERFNQMDSHNWHEVGAVFLKKYPEYGLKLAEHMLEKSNDSIFSEHKSITQNVLNVIAREHPKEVWEIVKKYLGPPLDGRAFHVHSWLQGSDLFVDVQEGALGIFSLQDIWAWVDQDMENRAMYLATFVPKALFRSDDKICLARELLIRYGNRADVRRCFTSNYFSEGWMGPASQHFLQRKNQIIDMKKGETEKNILLWIDEYLSSLDLEIENSKIREEREPF